MSTQQANPAPTAAPTQQEVAVDRAQTAISRGYLPVDMALLVPGPKREFDLFRRTGKEMVLFCAASYRLSASAMRHVRNDGESTLYVPCEQGSRLTEYAEKALSSTMKDTRLPLTRRTEILHTTARTIMADVLSNPTSGDVVRRCARIANGTVDLFAQDPAALRTMAALFTRDYYTYTHCVHTCVLGVAMYKYLISPKIAELRRFGMGMLLHDVGKSLVDVQILNKPSRLNELEFKQMQSHPLMGWKALEQQGVSDGLIRQAVLMHHEKLDGSGYPGRLTAKDLEAPARVAALVDVYDALTTDRQYRPAMTHRQAADLMRNTMLGEHLDPEYFTALERVCRSFGFRSSAKTEPSTSQDS